MVPASSSAAHGTSVRPAPGELRHAIPAVAVPAVPEARRRSDRDELAACDERIRARVESLRQDPEYATDPWLRRDEDLLSLDCGAVGDL